MLSKTYSYGICGLNAFLVTIEIDSSRGLPSTTIVGLPDNAIKESKERVKSAIKNCGYEYGPLKVVINLSPADVKKEGPSFDLAIALGILASTDQINSRNIENYVMMGELSLNGDIKPIKGTLITAIKAKKSQFRGILIPAANLEEAVISGYQNIYPVKNITDVIHFLNDPESIKPADPKLTNICKNKELTDLDFSDVKGQQHAKRGLEIAAAGGHNCLLIGPPGTGKSMLAKRLPSILPDMETNEIIETTKIYSIVETTLRNKFVISTRPFRSPHHTTSDVAIVGGGSNPKPGEVTLSHNGILFLDELPEFNKNVLESLRQPLEDRNVTIARASQTIKFPADFMLIAAMNPCPCGFYTDKKVVCNCSPNQINKYLSKISGPLLDRIDLHINVPAINYTDLTTETESESSEKIKQRIVDTKTFQQKRLSDNAVKCNASMTHKQTRKFCKLSDDCKLLLKTAMDRFNISARAYDKILKIARTISDLDQSMDIQQKHLAEAISFRGLDKNIF